MIFELEPLPYDKKALKPHLSEEALTYHYDKHHMSYMKNLAKMLDGRPEAEKSLEEIVKSVDRERIFNNAAQVWNHNFYFRSMKPNGGGQPTAALAEAIRRDYGSYTEFREKFHQAALSQFGSGWAWLVVDSNEKLKILTTSNANTPFAQGMKCLCVADLWEHAYYIDYRNLRAEYIDVFMDKLMNWDFAEENYAKK